MRTEEVLLGRQTVAVAFLGAAAFFSVLGSALVAAAAGFASFFASFTGPEVPLQCVSLSQQNSVDTWRAKLTLGLCEVALFLARGDGTVDMVPEGSLAEVADLVVCLDVLLDSLTAADTFGSARALRWVKAEASSRVTTRSDSKGED